MGDNICKLTTIKYLSIGLGGESSRLKEKWLSKLFEGISNLSCLTTLQLDLRHTKDLSNLSGISKLNQLKNISEIVLSL